MLGTYFNKHNKFLDAKIKKMKPKFIPTNLMVKICGYKKLFRELKSHDIKLI